MGCIHPAVSREMFDRNYPNPVGEGDTAKVPSLRPMMDGVEIPCSEAIAIHRSWGENVTHPSDIQWYLTASWVLMMVAILLAYIAFFEQKGESWD